MVHKGEGGQKSPKIGPHGLRMPPHETFQLFVYNFCFVFTGLPGASSTVKPITKPPPLPPRGKSTNALPISGSGNKNNKSEEPNIGKMYAFKKYDQFALNTSCFYPSCAISRNFCYKNNE